MVLRRRKAAFRHPIAPCWAIPAFPTPPSSHKRPLRKDRLAPRGGKGDMRAHVDEERTGQVSETGRGKVAIVTGGTRGIGAAIVRRLLAEGYAVATCGRTPPEQPIAFEDKEAEFDACDIRDPA